MFSPSFTAKPKRGVTKNNLDFCEVKASLTRNVQRQNREEGDADRESWDAGVFISMASITNHKLGGLKQQK